MKELCMKKTPGIRGFFYSYPFKVYGMVFKINAYISNQNSTGMVIQSAGQGVLNAKAKNAATPRKANAMR